MLVVVFVHLKGLGSWTVAAAWVGQSWGHFETVVAEKSTFVLALEPYVVASHFEACASPGCGRRGKADPCLALDIFGGSLDPFYPEYSLGCWSSLAH